LEADLPVHLISSINIEEGVGFERVREVEVEAEAVAPAARASAAVEKGADGGGGGLGGAMLGAENLGV
jgi:hypothetical protein